MDEKSLIEIYNQASNFFYNPKINRTAKSKHWETLYNKNKFNIENLKNFRNLIVDLVEVWIALVIIFHLNYMLKWLKKFQRTTY